MVSPLPRLRSRLTGRTGMRIGGWFRPRIVMTVEVLTESLARRSPTNRDGSPNFDPDEVIGRWVDWRDMLVSDLPSYVAAIQQAGRGDATEPPP